MAEDSVEKESGERINLHIRRNKVENPSQEEIDYVIQKFFPLVKSGFIDGLGERRMALEYLSKYKLDEQENSGTSLSRPLLCAVALLYKVSDHCIGIARSADRENHIEQFRFFYDFGRGSELVLHSIFQAEEGLSGRGEETRLMVISYESKIKLSMTAGEAAEEYLRMKRGETDSLQLLRKDPSGFLLLDSVVEKVKADSGLRIGLHTKEYVLAGAELARDLYKQLYEIAAPLYPEK